MGDHHSDVRIPLNCPKCGCSMEPPPDAPEPADRILVVECPLHGLFHFGPKTDLTAGLPPEHPTRTALGEPPPRGQEPRVDGAQPADSDALDD
jgi:hypothetical protein